MALPARIRRAMEAEGQTLEGVATEIQTGRVAIDLVPGDDGDDDDDTVVLPAGDADGDTVEGVVVAPNDDDGDIDPDLTLDDDAPALPGAPDARQTPAPVQTPVAPGQSSDTPPVVPVAHINPFDVGLEPIVEQPVVQPTGQAPAAQQPVQIPVVGQTAPVGQRPTPGAVPDYKQVLSAAEIAMLGGDAQAQVFVRMMHRMALDPMSRLQSSIEQQGTTVQQERVRAFRAGVAASVSQYPQIVESRSWQNYLKEYSPFAGTSVRDALLAADARFDQQAVLGIFKGFTDRYKTAPQPEVNAEKGKPARPKPADLATPSKSAVSNPAAPGKRFKFKESYASNLDDLRRRKKITSVEYQDKLAEYEKALVQGKVKLGA